jgi:hypothetical protein
VDEFPGKDATDVACTALLLVTIAKFLALARKSARSVGPAQLGAVDPKAVS